MSDEQDWNDDTRGELRETLRSVILGEVRLARRDRDAILDECRDVYIEEDSPESEWSQLAQYATEQHKQAVAAVTSEQQTWPDVTDCDRLDRGEAALRELGILLWQVSPCCDTCTGGELPDRIDWINDRYPGFRESVRGYAFFIDQNMPEMLAEATDVTVYLAYGWFSPQDDSVAPELYEQNALAVAREVCDCLRSQGLQVDWNNDFSRKIGVRLKWQRRTMLE